jgi:hypothetical protein
MYCGNLTKFADLTQNPRKIIRTPNPQSDRKFSQNQVCSVP